MLELFLFLVVVVLAILYFFSIRKIRELQFEKRSLSSKYGKMSEQFFPFLKEYKHDPSNFRFLGTPVDGVQFDQDKIIFVEFKTGESKLSENQKRIRDLIASNKVEFEEIKIK